MIISFILCFIILLLSLKRELCDHAHLHAEFQEREEKLQAVSSVLSETQALLLVERTNSQQMALHIDLLKVKLLHVSFYPVGHNLVIF